METSMRGLTVFLLVLWASSGVYAANECAGLETCDQCTSNADYPQCGWCEQAVRGYHCINDAALCPEKNLFHNFTNKRLSITEDDFNDKVVIKPTTLSVQLRPGSPYIFDLLVKPAANYPLDIYYLMDLSSSMKADLTVVKKYSRELAEWVRTLNNAENRVGFGSFIEKMVSPFWGNGDPPIYSFKSSFPLQSDATDHFEASIDKLSTIKNRDWPEAQLDALLQAIVCKKEIDWRDGGRKIIFLATDDTFHISGDGKLGGILEPSDGTCKVQKCTQEMVRQCTDSDKSKCVCPDTDPFYYDGVAQDYPTIGQVKQALLKENIFPVFAVHEVPHREPTSHYQNLVNTFTFGKVTSLASDSWDFIDRLNEAYLGLISSVELHATKDEREIVKRISLNGISSNEKPPRAKQPDVTIGEDIITFEVTLMTESNQIKTSVDLTVVGLTTLNVAVSSFGSCSCSSQGTERDPCSMKGTVVCGKCQCDRGSFGYNCQCDRDLKCNEEQILKLTVNGKLCNNKGSCNCGECECQEEYFGATCECPKACPMGPGPGSSLQKCSGNGICVCGRCDCRDGYDGDNCSCPIGDTSNNFCRTQSTSSNMLSEPCNGVGTCTCGVCYDCEEGYSGEKCNICDEEALKHKGLSCPKPLECKSASSCSECFDENIVGVDQCNWCPGDSTVSHNNGETNDTISFGCYPAASASDSCFCKDQGNGNATHCNLHTHKDQCANCEMKTTCKDCKSTSRIAPIAAPKSYACEWCGDRCVSYELKTDICKVEIDEELPCGQICLTSVSEKTCKDKDKINSALLDFACKNNGVVDAQVPNGSTFKWPWCYVPNNLPEDICENEDYVLLWASECPTPVNKTAVIVGVLAGVVGTSLVALLVWKVLTSIKDKKEWEKWEKDIADSKWHASQNPLFQSSTTEYINPTYQG